MVIVLQLLRYRENLLRSRLSSWIWLLWGFSASFGARLFKTYIPPQPPTSLCTPPPAPSGFPSLVVDGPPASIVLSLKHAPRLGKGHRLKPQGARLENLFSTANPQPKKNPPKKHTTVGIRWWSPTQLLIYRSKAYIWQSGRDAQFFLVYGTRALD